jgi:hypothetical protein
MAAISFSILRRGECDVGVVGGDLGLLLFPRGLELLVRRTGVVIGNVVNAFKCQASRFVWSAVVSSYYVKICAERSLASGHRSGIGM